jgi:hypothetical protein
VFSFTVIIKYKEKENKFSGPVPYVSEGVRKFCAEFGDFRWQKFNQHFEVLCAGKGKVPKNFLSPTLMEKSSYKHSNFDIALFCMIIKNRGRKFLNDKWGYRGFLCR